MNPDGIVATDVYVRSLVFSPDSKFLVTGSEDFLIRVWDISSESVLQTLSAHTQEIYTLDWSKDGSIIVSGSGDQTIKVWNATTFLCSLTIKIASDISLKQDCGITSLQINPLDSRCVVTVKLLIKGQSG